MGVVTKKERVMLWVPTQLATATHFEDMMFPNNYF